MCFCFFRRSALPALCLPKMRDLWIFNLPQRVRHGVSEWVSESPALRNKRSPPFVGITLIYGSRVPARRRWYKYTPIYTWNQWRYALTEIFASSRGISSLVHIMDLCGWNQCLGSHIHTHAQLFDCGWRLAAWNIAMMGRSTLYRSWVISFVLIWMTMSCDHTNTLMPRPLSDGDDWKIKNHQQVVYFHRILP